MKVGQIVRFRVSRPGGVAVLTGRILFERENTVLISVEDAPMLYSVRKADVIGGRP